MEPGTDLLDAVKNVHRQFPTGVTVVTAQRDGQTYGLAINAFSSVSLEPPVVLVSVAATAETHPRLFGVDHVAVNILAEDQTELLAAFAKSGGDKFAGVSWSPGPQGSPILDGCAATLELQIEKRLQAYTHTIFTGRVIAATASDRPPLLYLGSKLFRSSDLTPAAGAPE